MVGAELSEKAVLALFEQRGVAPQITPWAGGQCYRHDNLTVFQGDIFSLDADTLGEVDAIYDRAALIALPDAMRERYAAHLMALTHSAPQLLITLSYDQARMAGPPFSVDQALVETLYGHRYRIEPLSRKDIIANEAMFAERGLEALYEECCLLSP